MLFSRGGRPVSANKLFSHGHRWTGSSWPMKYAFPPALSFSSKVFIGAKMGMADIVDMGQVDLVVPVPHDFQFALLVPAYDPGQKVRVAFPPNEVRAEGQGLELSGIMGLENGLFRHGLGQGIKRYPVFDAGQGFRACAYGFSGKVTLGVLV